MIISPNVINSIVKEVGVINRSDRTVSTVMVTKIHVIIRRARSPVRGVIRSGNVWMNFLKGKRLGDDNGY